MANLTQLRMAAREIFDEALRAVDAGVAVSQAVALEGSRLRVRNRSFELQQRNIYSIAIGKAALPMALAVEDIFGTNFVAGLIAGPIAGQPLGREIAMPPRKLSTHWQWCEGGHPLPNKASLLAAKEAFALLERANEELAPIVFLISGGGSAMLEQPINEDITLKDLRDANKVLVTSGASIVEINSVRRAFSATKGGRLAALAPNCDQITLIVSDVPEGEERNVASGPTLAPAENAPDPRDIIAQYDLRSRLPPSITRAIENTKSSDSTSASMREYFVLLNNRDAVEAAAQGARQRGFMTEIANDISDQPIEEGCLQLHERLELRARYGNAGVNRLEAGLVPPVGTRADSKQNHSSVCLISGGEFACPVKDNGIGGRNLETALRLACSTNFSLSDRSFVALCAGTDGIDGNSPATGAIIDNTTIERAQRIGLDAQDFLDRSDAYSFFVALGDAITTGHTGTNVRDLRILLSAG